MGRPTIYDVAAHCGVAASTVSRAFSNPGRVGARTRQRVRQAARELGYEPRPLARAEPPGRSRTVTLVIADIANPYYAALVKAVQARAQELGYTLALADSDEQPRLEASNLRRLLATTGGGILATSRLSDEAVRRLARHRPLVTINREISGIPNLLLDTADGMRKAVRHLAALGHRRIAYLAGPRNSWMNGRRWRAVHAEATGIGVQAAYLGPHTPDREGGLEAADAFVLDGASAAIAYNDLMAIGVVQRLQRAGVRVPQQRSVIGCDDSFGADLLVPPLTTIAGPLHRLGAGAVDLLHAELTGTRAEPVALGTRLVVRGSTATPGN